MFQILFLITGFSPSYNFRIWMLGESKLKYTYHAFQDGNMDRNPNSFGSLIKPAKSSWNSTCGRILCFNVIDSNEHILSLKYQNHAIQKPKIIYTSRNTTFMKDVKSDKFGHKLKDKIGILIWWEN